MKNMISRTSLLSSVMVLVLLATACQDKKKATDPNANPNMHTVNVLEAIPTSNYTYFKVFENNQEYWIAVPAMEAKKGDVLYYTQAMEMQQFESKELGRTFESVFFVSDISTTPIPVQQTPSGNSPQGKVLQPREEGLVVTPAEGSISIGKLYQNRDDYAGKEVVVTGKVVKFSAEIMSRNWVHIQDGTENNGSYDLTITTKDAVNTGDILTFRGVVHLNKDFGAGYKYEVIMEDAVVVRQ